MVTETKQDGSKTSTGTSTDGWGERAEGRGRERGEIETGSEIGKSHGTPSHSASEFARRLERMIPPPSHPFPVIPKLLFPKHRSP